MIYLLFVNRNFYLDLSHFCPRSSVVTIQKSRILLLKRSVMHSTMIPVVTSEACRKLTRKIYIPACVLAVLHSPSRHHHAAVYQKSPTACMSQIKLRSFILYSVDASPGVTYGGLTTNYGGEMSLKMYDELHPRNQCTFYLLIFFSFFFSFVSLVSRRDNYVENTKIALPLSMCFVFVFFLNKIFFKKNTTNDCKIAYKVSQKEEKFQTRSNCEIFVGRFVLGNRY